MGSEREQELARTATAPGSGATEPAEPVGATLGRYRLERELGAGAMGVVHAAFDPDLERRIALKVLRGATATVEAKDRLMREARAMARLTHPNVVTVHEVGTASGRDFIAMELIHGESLAEWLRAEPRSPAAIVEAFVGAGRGLAAAHAAGVVHRDFKPHNVLRSRDGRIVVTDFGLAREAESAALPPALDATLPVGSVTSTPSSLSGLTMTGALLGTPAYMAPEQWRGGAVTPATDQFAYCVALWEALAGARPYPGPTLEDLRGQVARGPGALDASRIPRRLRSVLRRGLDPDPAERWPNMETLLARLTRAQRRPGVALAIAGGAIAAAAIAVFALRPAAPVAMCEPPARDVDTVWSPAIRAEFAAKTSAEHVAVLDMAYWDWRATRGAACGAAPQVRLAQLQCLDGALARFDALRQAFARAPGAAAEDIQAQLVDPAICRRPVATEIPRLTLKPTPEVIQAYALLGRSYAETKPGDAEIAAVAGAPNGDPCARGIAALAFESASHDVPRARSLMADAVGAADQCGDERLRADLLISDIQYHLELPVIGPRGEAAIRLARSAAAHVMQPEIEAWLTGYTVLIARQAGHWDEAFKLIDTELADYRARGLPRRVLAAMLWRNNLRLSRCRPADLEAVRRDVQAARPLAAPQRADLTRQLDVQDAVARYRLGDVAGSRGDLLRLWRQQPPGDRPRRTRRVTGQVVDPAGRPIAGAQVAADAELNSDSVGIGIPGFLAEPDLRDSTLRIVTSDAAGQFVIEDAVPEGVMAAELGDLRSKPAALADHVRLVLEPTHRVSGKVKLGSLPYSQVFVVCAPVGDPTGRLLQTAPVAPDGSFVLDRTWTGPLRVGATLRGTGEQNQHLEFQPVAASRGPVTGIAIDPALSTRTIDVVVRSAVATPLDGGQVVLLAGHQTIGNLGDLIRVQMAGVQTHMARPVVGENVPRAVLDKVRSGDLVAHVEHARPGDLTVCAIGLTGDLLDPDYIQTLQSHLSELAVKCEHVGPTASVVTLAVPPQQRFDDK